MGVARGREVNASRVNCLPSVDPGMPYLSGKATPIYSTLPFPSLSTKRGGEQNLSAERVSGECDQEHDASCAQPTPLFLKQRFASPPRRENPDGANGKGSSKQNNTASTIHCTASKTIKEGEKKGHRNEERETARRKWPDPSQFQRLCTSSSLSSHPGYIQQNIRFS